MPKSATRPARGSACATWVPPMAPRSTASPRKVHHGQECRERHGPQNAASFAECEPNIEPLQPPASGHENAVAHNEHEHHGGRDRHGNDNLHGAFYDLWNREMVLPDYQ